jgi:hypothetical protein
MQTHPNVHTEGAIEIGEGIRPNFMGLPATVEKDHLRRRCNYSVSAPLYWSSSHPL